MNVSKKKTDLSIKKWLPLICLIAYSSLGQSQLQLLKEPEELVGIQNARRGKEINVTLDIKYANNTIFNPSISDYDRVWLRSYNGGLVGPTIRVKPGDTLRVQLQNNLPKNDPSCSAQHYSHNIPNCFNTTNLHTHGWHVSPAGNSDNVLLELRPGMNFGYEFNLPENHPAGTFWYHSHRHGSTALQVTSGMLGALIVEGNRRVNDKSKNGIADIDTILKYSSGRRFTERLMLFEQIQYSCGKKEDGATNWNCEGKTGEVEEYEGQFGPGSWDKSGRFTLINGAVQPIIRTSESGKIERWRLIHGGVRDTINLKLTASNIPLPTKTAAALSIPRLKVEEQQGWIEKNCLVNEVTPQWEIAVDGLTRNKITKKEINVFQPGYRSDTLVFFKRPGVYCVVDEAAPSQNVINPENRKNKDRRLLGLIEVQPGLPVIGDEQSYLTSQLVAGDRELPIKVKDEIKRLDISTFSAHPEIKDSEVTSRQDLFFKIDVTSNPLRFEINGEPYDPARIDRLLALGGTDEWTLTSKFANHPFHIHVNPFQIAQILRPDGTSVINNEGKCVDVVKDPVSGKEILDTQYCDQIGLFRDTIFVKQGYKLVVRSRNEHYIGDFVLHCHILDHEDQGMMQNVRIVLAADETNHQQHNRKN